MIKLCNKYNGWTNYETWLVNLWMTNEENTQKFFQRAAEDHYESVEENDIFCKFDRAYLDFAEYIKESHMEVTYEMNFPIEGVMRDLLNAALSRVDWDEIAKGWMEEFK